MHPFLLLYSSFAIIFFIMLSNTGSLVAHITFGEPKIQQHQQHNLAVEDIKNKEDSITTTKVSFVVNSII
jgi:hypothetical protein